MGDQLDRGDNEIEILYFMERLAEEAKVRPTALTIVVIELPDTRRIKISTRFPIPLINLIHAIQKSTLLMVLCPGSKLDCYDLRMHAETYAWCAYRRQVVRCIF